MHLVVALLLACGTTETPVAATEAPAAVDAPAAVPDAPADAPAEDLPEAPEGYLAMTLLMPADTLEEGIVAGAFVDLVAGEGDSEELIAKEVEVLAIGEEERGKKVTLSVLAEHRARLLGSQLPGRPRAVLHK